MKPRPLFAGFKVRHFPPGGRFRFGGSADGLLNRQRVRCKASISGLVLSKNDGKCIILSKHQHGSETSSITEQDSCPSTNCSFGARNTISFLRDVLPMFPRPSGSWEYLSAASSTQFDSFEVPMHRKQGR